MSVSCYRSAIWSMFVHGSFIYQDKYIEAIYMNITDILSIKYHC